MVVVERFSESLKARLGQSCSHSRRHVKGRLGEALEGVQCSYPLTQ